MSFQDWYKQAQPLIAEAKKSGYLGVLISLIAEAAPADGVIQRRTTGPAARATTRPRGRPRSTAAKGASPAAATPFGEKVYGLIPATGGIQQTSIKIAGTKPNNIGMALSRLQKAGRLTSQGAGKTKTWFHAETGLAQRAA